MGNNSHPVGPAGKIRVVPWQSQSGQEAPPTEQEAEALLRKEGYEPFRWHDVPGAAYPLHRHAADECLWVLQGEMTLTIYGSDYLLKTGDRLYLPARTPHTAKVPVARSVTYLVGQKP